MQKADQKSEILCFIGRLEIFLLIFFPLIVIILENQNANQKKQQMLLQFNLSRTTRRVALLLHLLIIIFCLIFKNSHMLKYLLDQQIFGITCSQYLLTVLEGVMVQQRDFLTIFKYCQECEGRQMLALLIFRASDRKSSGEQANQIYSQMGKSVVVRKNSSHRQSKTSNIKKGQLQLVGAQRSQPKYAQFFEFLKGVHGWEGREKETQVVNGPLVREVSESVMHFFNREKNYQPEELERYVIYLANLLNILREENTGLVFEGEFKSKIRRFLSWVMQARSEGKSKNSKIQALLYILAILIYKERVNQDHSYQELNHSIYSDRSLVKLLLSLTLTKYKKMSKFFGVIMVHLSNQTNSIKIKQAILRSIFTNISIIDHEPTFFNFLSYLRMEKNKVKINCQDVLDGRIFEILIEAYPKHANSHQSFYIIDYLNHLLTLFPVLVSKIPKDNFIPDMLLWASPVNAYHPLQESTIISFVQATLKYAESNAKNIILNQIIDCLLVNRQLALKLGHIVLDYEVEGKKMMELLEGGYFETFLDLVSFESEEMVAKKAIELYKKAIAKLEGMNKLVSQYMSYQLDCRMRVMHERRRIAQLV